MRAALLEKPQSDLVVVDDVDIAEPEAGQLLVRIAYCGVCHSDLHVIDGGLGRQLPVVLGHEAGGVVEAVGPGVSQFLAGDKVILTLRPVCGRCYFCSRGEPTLCQGMGGRGGAGRGAGRGGASHLSRAGEPVYPGVGLGAFAERVICSVNAAVKVPDDTPLEIACIIGCAVQTGVGAAVNTAKVQPGDTVVVQGLGGVGIAIVQGARIAGASQIIAVDPVEERRDASRRFGATATIDPAASDVVAEVQALTGIGADVAFDAVGMSQLIETGIMATRPGGMTVCVGVPRPDDAITIRPAVMFALGEKKLSGCFLGTSNPNREFPRLLALWRAGRLDLEGMVTRQRPLEEINDAFADMKAGRGIRTVLEIAP
jgi:Zn-dependent alcohol dehydrogenase